MCASIVPRPFEYRLGLLAVSGFEPPQRPESGEPVSRPAGKQAATPESNSKKAFQVQRRGVAAGGQGREKRGDVERSTSSDPVGYLGDGDRRSRPGRPNRAVVAPSGNVLATNRADPRRGPKPPRMRCGRTALRSSVRVPVYP